MSKRKGEASTVPLTTVDAECESCRFFESVGKVGECRRYPPIADIAGPTPIGPRMFFPVVEADCWCGEYQKAKPGDPK